MSYTRQCARILHCIHYMYGICILARGVGAIMRKFHRTFTAYLFLRCAFIERIGRTECCPRATENKLIPQIE